jgi:hypothetical protein
MTIVQVGLGQKERPSTVLNWKRLGTQQARGGSTARPAVGVLSSKEDA